MPAVQVQTHTMAKARLVGWFVSKACVREVVFITSTSSEITTAESDRSLPPVFVNTVLGRHPGSFG